jgi:hypothetical protein
VLTKYSHSRKANPNSRNGSCAYNVARLFQQALQRPQVVKSGAHAHTATNHATKHAHPSQPPRQWVLVIVLKGSPVPRREARSPPQGSTQSVQGTRRRSGREEVGEESEDCVREGPGEGEERCCCEEGWSAKKESKGEEGEG